jgi:hypothetical protein
MKIVRKENEYPKKYIFDGSDGSSSISIERRTDVMDMDLAEHKNLSYIPEPSTRPLVLITLVQWPAPVLLMLCILCCMYWTYCTT